MKKTLLIVFVLWSTIAFEQTNYTKINNRYTWLAIQADNGFNFPAGRTHTLFTGQSVRAGAVIYDSVQGKLYVNIGANTWRPLVDTTYIGFLSSLSSLGSGYKIYTTGVKTLFGDQWLSLDSVANSGAITINNLGLFGKSGNDVRATAGRAFSFAGLDNLWDSMGDTRFAMKTPKKFLISAVNSATTDSGYFLLQRIAGITPSTTVQMGLTTTATATTGLFRTKKLGSGGAITNEMSVDGGFLSHVNYIVQDTGSIQIASARTFPTYKQSYAYLYPDSLLLQNGDQLPTSYLRLFYGGADQWANDSLVWRRADRNSFYKITDGFGHIYADDSLLFESESGYYRFTDLLATTDTSTYKPGAYDASGNLKRFSYWPGAGGSVPTFPQTAAAGNTYTAAVVFFGNSLYGTSFPNQTDFNISDSGGVTNRFSIASFGIRNTKITSAVRSGHTTSIDLRPDSATVETTNGTGLRYKNNYGNTFVARSLVDKNYVDSSVTSAGSVTASSATTFTNKRWTARVGSATSSATPTINTDNVDIYKLTAQSADITSFTTNLSGTPVDGDILEIQVTGTAARALTFGSSFVSSTVTIPTTTVTTATLTIIFQFYTTSSYGTSKWVCVNYY